MDEHSIADFIIMIGMGLDAQDMNADFDPIVDMASHNKLPDNYAPELIHPALSGGFRKCDVIREYRYTNILILRAEWDAVRRDMQ